MKKVLVLEDEASIRSFIVINLQRAGYEVVDVKVTLLDGSYHEVDSSEMAFKICGSMAFKEACQKAGPTLLEPIMKVVVTAPESYMGDVMGAVSYTHLTLPTT